MTSDTKKFISATELKKLHKQFGHCSTTALSRLLTSAKYKFSKRELDLCLEQCEFCQANAKPARKPVVSLPLSSSFNETVALDLSCLKNGTWFLQIICQFSRFCVAVTVPDKTSKSVVSAFYRYWVTVFGPPKASILTDNGGEFKSDLLRDFCEKLNFKLSLQLHIRLLAAEFVKGTFPF